MASTLSRAGYILALIGGIFIILFALFDQLGVLSRVFRFFSLFPFLSGTITVLVHIVIGIICIIGSRYVSSLVWAIVLIILGLVAGNLGGSLVILGAILGLLSTLLKPKRK